MLGHALPLQGGHAWTEVEDAAVKAGVAAADRHARLDWDAVAACPGLSARSAVRIHTRA